MTTLENLLVFHCAPTLMGVKQANLFSCPGENVSELLSGIELYNRMLNSKDIYLKILYVCKNKFFVIVYRKSQLSKTLKSPGVIPILTEAGYPVSALENNDDIMLDYLSTRITGCDSFPHEIGLFLGYPPEDVKEFIKHEGKNYKFCGYWKVYCDEEQAKKQFSKFNDCRDILSKKTASGMPVLKALEAVLI